MPGLCLAQFQSSPVMDAALSMLEKGNPFLVHYRQVTGSQTDARFPLGCPYFWGGRSESRLLDTMQPWQTSSQYYKISRSYLYGFDCTGFTRWALETAGFSKHPPISDMLDLPEMAMYEIEGTSGIHGEPLASFLTPGDLLAIRHEKTSYHVAMYAGTLLDYGYRADTVPPELIPYLAYPLLVHCTVHSDYYERYEAWIEDAFDWHVYPPDGGVIISIMDVPKKAATRTMLSPLNEEQYYFVLDGYKLLIYDSYKDAKTKWIRWLEP